MFPSNKEKPNREEKGRREWKIQILNDVVEEIVMRLPVRSLVRFQIVSKHWDPWISQYIFFGGGGEDTWLIRKAKILNSCFSRSLEHLCLEQSALEKTSASFENRLIFKIEEIKGVIKISECCDGLLWFDHLTKALSLLNMATKTLLKFQRLYKRPFHS